MQGASVIGSTLGGIGTTTPWKSAFAIEQNGANPSFVVGDTGSSSPLFFVNANRRIGIGTSSPGALFAIDTTTVADSRRNLFYVGSSTQDTFIIDNKGRVAIGSSSPQFKLSIFPGSDNGAIGVYGSGYGIHFKDAGDTIEWGTLVSDSGGSGSLRLTTSGSGRPLILQQNNGNVGIGTTNPQTQFYMLGDATIGTDLYVSGSDFNLGTGSGTSTLSSATSGKLGLGTTSPAGLFSVATSTATSTFHLGTGGSTTQGSCLQMYDAGGTAYRLYITKASTTLLGVEKGPCE